MRISVDSWETRRLDAFVGTEHKKYNISSAFTQYYSTPMVEPDVEASKAGNSRTRVSFFRDGNVQVFPH
jgi:hypothetical protein